MPWLWNLVDIMNSLLFNIRYGKTLLTITNTITKIYEKKSGLKIVPMRDVPAEKISSFFIAQPENSYDFFKPHGFDVKSIKRLQRLNSFLGYVFFEGEDVVAYCFIRAFFHGKGFRGRMVGVNRRGHGLGTLMNRMMNDVGFGIGLRLFETVSRRNVASYRSATSASNVKVLKEMDNDDLYLEILKD